MSAVRRRYGAHLWHLLVLVACVAVTGYAVSRLLGDRTALVRITIWFLGAAVLWDLVVGPLLAAADRGLRPLHRVRLRGVPALNFVRVPALLSGLLLLLWTPLVLRRSEDVYESKSALPIEPYLGRWAAVTAVIVLASAAAYGAAVLRARRD